MGFKYEHSIPSSALEMGMKINAHLNNGGKLSDLDNPINYNMPWMEKLVEMEKMLKEIGSVF